MKSSAADFLFNGISTPRRQDAKAQRGKAATQGARQEAQTQKSRKWISEFLSFGFRAFPAAWSHYKKPRRNARSGEITLQRGKQFSSASLRLGVLALILFSLCLPAATNDLTTALQRGLFEEEANHNLDAAAQAYQEISAQFDKDRKLAATAIFRLGEVYRKQGRTNEAVAQYERIVREFSDQQTLATLSRQNLSGLRQSPVLGDIPMQGGVGNASEEATRLAAQLRGIEQLKDNPEEQARAVLAFFPDEILKKMLLQLPKLKEQEAFLKTNSEAGTSASALLPKILKRGGWNTAFGPDGLEPPRYGANVVTDAEHELKKQLSWMKERVDFTVGVQKARLQVLQAVAAKTPTGEVATSETSAPTTDDEEKEIRRIQVMIKNSPDLINAPGDGGYTPLCRAASAGWLRVAAFLLDGGAAVNRASQNATALHLAAAGGHKAMIELLAKRGADLNAHDGSGATPLHLAAEKGFLSIAETLVDLKADLEARNSKMNGEQTPLHRAVVRGHQAMVAFLISQGADLEATNSNGSTALMMAAGAGHTDVFRKLLAAGAKPDARDASGATASMAAAANGNSEIVQALLTAKANPDLIDNEGRTALSKAVQNGHTEVAKSLLAAKAEPNAGTIDSPLLSAVRAENVELVELLLRAGADPNQPTDCELYSMVRAGGSVNVPGTRQFTWSAEKRRVATRQRGKRTPLQAAVLEDHGSMLKLLLQFKGDAKANDPEGFPLVLSAVENPEMLKALLEAGADADASDGKGRYLLTLAAGAGNAAAVDLLLARGAKTEVRNETGYTPLLCAIDNGNTNCVASLLAGKADVNAATESKWTPLHTAVSYGRKAILQILLEKGANPNVRDNDGNTPLDLTELRPGMGRAILPQRPGEAPRASMAELAELLRQHGALDELPFFDRIEVRRPGYSGIAFEISTNGWNDFSLLELLAQHYGFLTTQLNAVWEVNKPTVPSQFWGKAACQFPDLSRVVIRRPDRGAPRWTEISVNAAALLDSGDCGRDVKLQPGDIVEIPEADHPVNEKWAGLAEPQISNLLHCVSRTITISVKGGSTPITLSPRLLPNYAPAPGGEQFGLFTRGSFMLKSVLAQSRLLRASSDISRVKVIRQVDGKPREWVLDCGLGSDPDLWLRDGDVIEVPDKP